MGIIEDVFHRFSLFTQYLFKLFARYAQIPPWYREKKRNHVKTRAIFFLKIDNYSIWKSCEFSKKKFLCQKLFIDFYTQIKISIRFEVC